MGADHFNTMGQDDLKPKTYTWGDLKDFVNSLEDGHLSEKIIWWGDETGGTIGGAFKLEEDYTSIGDEGLEPVSVYADNPELQEDIANDKMKVLKGTPILLA